MQFSVNAAKINLAKLIDAALAGEEVVITKDEQPMVKLVPVERRQFRLGILQDQLGDGPDFFEPMSRDELDRWEGVA